MDAAEVAEELCWFEGRGPGTDAERRAAVWLAEALRDSGRGAELETVWVRPHEPVSLALHALVAVAGSVLTAFQTVAGVAVIAAALLSLVLDLHGVYLLRRLTFRRATQNVVSPAPEREGQPAPVRLVITARYDAGRSGLLRRPALQRLGARAPGPRALMVLGVTCALAAAAARLLTQATWVGGVQLVPTVALLVAFALLMDLAVGPRSDGASDASAVGVALALASALDAAPPRHVDVDVVLAGAGSAPTAGFRAFVRARRKHWAPESVAVVHVEPCARQRPRWWVKDGPLPALRMHPRMVALAAQIAENEPHLQARPHAGHGVTAAYAARTRQWPAIAVGCLDRHGRAPGRDGPQDTPEALDPDAMEAALELCLALVDELDADLERLQAPSPEPARAG